MEVHIMIIALQSVKGLGNKTIRNILNVAFSIAEVVKIQNTSDIKGVTSEHLQAIKMLDWNMFAQKYERMRGFFKIVAFTDDDYPSILKNHDDFPLLLYIRGEMIENDKKAIAIVGTRNATAYGEKQAYLLAYELARHGVCVISGLAKGIDIAAHRGAIEGKGRTIAVLGNGIDTIYPKHHTAIAQKIETCGACISEYGPGVTALPHHFPRRNRIVAALSLGIVVVEAPTKSGAMITAHIGLEQGKEIFAIPGSIESQNSEGCHRLIQQGAKLVIGIDDILEELSIEEHKKEPEIISLKDIQKEIWDSLLDTPQSIEDIINKTGLPPQKVSSELMLMSMDGIVLCANRNYCRSAQWKNVDFLCH